MAETAKHVSYEENCKNFFTATSLKEPKWVPIGIDTNAWTLAHANVPTYEAQADGVAYANAKLKVIKELHPDYVLDLHVGVPPIRLIHALGGHSLQMCEDGYTVQHTMQGEIMHADEYDQFIKDPNKFVLNTLAPRKYSKMNGNRNDMRAAMQEATPLVLEMLKAAGIIIEECAKEGIIIAWDSSAAPFNPLDEIFDMHRGFRGLLTDLRRQPKKVKAACDSLFEQKQEQIASFTQKVLNAPEKPVIPLTGSVFHVVPYLSPKQFEEFWWPYFKATFLPMLEGGATLFIKGEGKAAHIMKYFEELPKGTVILQPEEDDYYDVYPKYFKDKMTMCGGIRLNTIKCGTTEQCKDEIKRAIDTFAPGGGFILANDRAFMSKNDADPNRLKELYAFAREYGKY